MSSVIAQIGNIIPTNKSGKFDVRPSSTHRKDRNRTSSQHRARARRVSSCSKVLKQADAW